MSSHHFVKEDQEPALLIRDASGVPFGVVEQLLEWSPTVVVLEEALDVVLSWGIKIDAVVCPPDTVKEELEKLKDQAPVKVLSHDSDNNPLDTAMMFLGAGKHQAVNVIGAVPDEIERFARVLDVVSFSSGTRWSFARNGKFEKWLAQGTQLVIPAHIRNSTGLDSTGMAIRDGLVTIESEQPFWVGEGVN
jgi:hypothetical protein